MDKIIPNELPVWLAISKIAIGLPENHALKGKRKVVSSLCDQLRHKFRASVAEVGSHEAWQRTQIAVVMVTNEVSQARKMNNELARYITTLRRPDWILLDHHCSVLRC